MGKTKEHQEKISLTEMEEVLGIGTTAVSTYEKFMNKTMNYILIVTAILAYVFGPIILYISFKIFF